MSKQEGFVSNLGFFLPSLGPAELVVILGVAVLIFGGKKIPELGKGIGEGIRNFKAAMTGSGDEKKQPEKEKTA